MAEIQPLDTEYLEWLSSSDTSVFLSADTNPVVKLAFKFVSSMASTWGGWLGYTYTYGTAGEDLDGDGRPDPPQLPFVETPTTGQYCAQANGSGNWNSDGTRKEGYPWYLLKIDSHLMASLGDPARARIDPCWENSQYRKADYQDKSRYQRQFVSQGLNGLTDICFGVIVYRFLKADIGKNIRNYLSNIHPSDKGLPQPELLLYLYEQLSYLTDLNSERTLDYLYTRIPDIFYPYRNAFVAKVKTKKNYGGYGCGKNDAYVKSYDAQAVLGITDNFPTRDSATLNGPYDYPGEMRAFSPTYPYDGSYLNGRQWWHEELINRLPDSFVTPDSIASFLSFDFVISLQNHLDEFDFEYENYNYRVKNPITDRVDPYWGGAEGSYGPPTAEVSFSTIMDWWDTVIEAAYAAGTGAQKRDEALETEREDIENLDFTICETPIPGLPPFSQCGFCKPDPDALIPDWTQRTSDEPFRNGKTCEYSITMLTPYISPTDLKHDVDLSAAMAKAYETFGEISGNDLVDKVLDQLGIGSQTTAFIIVEQMKEGIKKLLKFYGKDSSEGTVLSLLPKTSNPDYFVQTRPNLKMKVLINLPVDTLDTVPNEGELTSDVSDEGAPPISVTLKGDDIQPLFRKAAKGMRKWGIKYEIDVYTGKSTSVPGLYWANAKGSLSHGLGNYKAALIQYLRKNNFRVNPARKKIAKLEHVILNFSENYELLSIQAKKVGCPQEEITKGLDAFKKTTPINDNIISRLVSKLPEIVDKMTAREPIKWAEFVATYLGMVSLDPSLIVDQENAQGPCSAGRVIANLFKPFVAIGAQAFGQILKFPQLFTASLGNQVCYSLEKKRKKEAELDDPSVQLQRQKEQWARENNATDSIFKDLPEILEQVSSLEELFSEVVDKLGVCGVAFLIQAALDCVMSGFGVEDGVKSWLVAQIKNGSDKQMKGLFFALNPGFQDLLKTALKELTEMPLPWEAGYEPGSYDGAGVSFSNKAYEQQKLAAFTRLGIEVSTDPPFKEEATLIWPDKCAEGKWCRPQGDPYEYKWTDMETLEYTDTRTKAKGIITLSEISKTHEVWDYKPFEEVIKKPLTKDAETEE